MDFHYFNNDFTASVNQPLQLKMYPSSSVINNCSRSLSSWYIWVISVSAAVLKHYWLGLHHLLNLRLNCKPFEMLRPFFLAHTYYTSRPFCVSWFIYRKLFMWSGCKHDCEMVNKGSEQMRVGSARLSCGHLSLSFIPLGLISLACLQREKDLQRLIIT